MIQVDTVILGGGPAGMSCALALQKKKLDMLVIEKRQFPREKTCGGLLTEKTVKQLQTLFDSDELEPVFCDFSDELELYDRDTRLTRSKLTRPFRSVHRREFDAFLAKSYTSRGGRLLENCFARAVDPKTHTLSLSTGETVSYKRLVVADGALSPTRKLLGLPDPPLAFCVETHVPKTDLPAADTVRIVFGLVPYGYAWVIPSGDTLCIGFGGKVSKELDFPQILRDWLTRLGLDAAKAKIKGAFVPFGDTVPQKRGLRDVLLVGDAGGYVDPIYGEGLYFALTSGICAAEAIAASPDDSAADYYRRMEPHRKLIREGRRFQRFFFSPFAHDIFLRRVAGKNRFVTFYIDHQLAQYGYPYSKMPQLIRDYHNGVEPNG